MLKINEKEDKSNTYNGFSCNVSFFIQGRTSSDEKFFKFFYILAIEEIDEILVKT